MSKKQFGFGGIDAGTNLLFSGPPMTGKYDLLLEFLSRECGAVIVITTKNGVETVRADVREHTGHPDDRIGVVDCVSNQRDVGDTTETDTVKYVASPENLTQMGVKFTSLFEHFYERDLTTRVGLHSLSQLLMYAEISTVYRFMQVLTGKIQSAGWVGGSVIDSTMHSEQAVYTLQELFDGIVETRTVDGGQREMRARGLGPEPTEWQTF